MPKGNPPETACSQGFARRELPTAIDGMRYFGLSITSSSELDVRQSIARLAQFLRSMVHHLGDRPCHQ